MTKLNRLAVCLRGNVQQLLRRNASHGHGHQVEKSTGPSNPLSQFLTKYGYWDQQAFFPEKITYRNNYGLPGGWNVPKKQVLAADILMGAFWGWMFWHLFHEIDHMIGHFHPPDPSLWTDAELGIPPDDVE